MCRESKRLTDKCRCPFDLLSLLILEMNVLWNKWEMHVDDAFPGINVSLSCLMISLDIPCLRWMEINIRIERNVFPQMINSWPDQVHHTLFLIFSTKWVYSFFWGNSLLSLVSCYFCLDPKFHLTGNSKEKEIRRVSVSHPLSFSPTRFNLNFWLRRRGRKGTNNPCLLIPF